MSSRECGRYIQNGTVSERFVPFYVMLRPVHMSNEPCKGRRLLEISRIVTSGNWETHAEIFIQTYSSTAVYWRSDATVAINQSLELRLRVLEIEVLRRVGPLEHEHQYKNRYCIPAVLLNRKTIKVIWFYNCWKSDRCIFFRERLESCERECIPEVKNITVL